MEHPSFDYLIVGGGSSGSVLANRLSENPQHSVCLIEAGPRDWSPWIHLPIGYAKTMWDPKVNWKFQTEPDPNMNQRQIYWPRGKTLGGSSSINGLIFIRGQKEDYDGWRDLGNVGWGWNDVLPYFKKAEGNDRLGEPLHSQSGPLKASSIPKNILWLKHSSKQQMRLAFQQRMISITSLKKVLATINSPPIKAFAVVRLLLT